MVGLSAVAPVIARHAVPPSAGAALQPVMMQSESQHDPALSRYLQQGRRHTITRAAEAQAEHLASIRHALEKSEAVAPSPLMHPVQPSPISPHPSEGAAGHHLSIPQRQPVMASASLGPVGLPPSSMQRLVGRRSSDTIAYQRFLAHHQQHVAMASPLIDHKLDVAQLNEEQAKLCESVYGA